MSARSVIALRSNGHSGAGRAGEVEALTAWFSSLQESAERIVA
jgi:hypothetical protein